MTPEEVFERADEIAVETRYRLQCAREARDAGFEAGRRSAFAEMARAWEHAAKAVTGQPVAERRWGPGGRAHSQTPVPVISQSGTQKPNKERRKNWRQDEQRSWASL